MTEMRLLYHKFVIIPLDFSSTKKTWLSKLYDLYLCISFFRVSQQKFENAINFKIKAAIRSCCTGCDILEKIFCLKLLPLCFDKLAEISCNECGEK